MLSGRINPDKCLVKVVYASKAFNNVKVNNYSHLKKGFLLHCQEDEQKKLIKQYLSKHVESRFIFSSPSKVQVDIKIYLSRILAAINDQVSGVNVLPSRMAAIMLKLTEDINYCSEGYLNRLYVIMGSFHQPQSIDELLAAYRSQLVEKAAAVDRSSGVHTHHRFYVIANALGYAIPYEEINDRYVGALSVDTIQQQLEKTFNEWYTPKKIINHIWEQAQLDLLGYVGKKDAEIGYTIEDFECFLAYFRKVLDWPALTLYTCFIIDEKTDAIVDINWNEINSYLIEHLETQGYFNPFENEIKFSYESIDESVTYTCNAHAFDDGLLIYTRNKSTRYQYGVLDRKYILQEASETLKLALDQWVSLRLSMPLALLNAVMNNKRGTVMQLINEKVPLSGETAEDGNGVLHHAVLKNSPKMIALLIRQGANIAKKNKIGKTAIQIAAEKKRWGCVSAFAKNKSEDNDNYHYGDALLRAVVCNKLNIATLLLDAKASIHWKFNGNENGVLHHAALHNQPVMVALLLKHGADVAKKNKDGKTAIQLAAYNNRWDCVEAFADNKSDNNGDCNYGDVLFCAVKANKIETATKLLKANANITWHTKDEENGVLHCASLNNNPAMIALLVKHGADVAKKNKAGKTAIQLAAINDRWECVEIFAESKPDYNGSYHYGSALLLAVMANKLDTVTNLLKAKASVGWQTVNDGNGVLHHAVMKDNPEMIALLITHGADVAKENRAGKTAFQLAIGEDNAKCVDAFGPRSPDCAQRKPGILPSL